MRIDIITIFPGMFSAVLDESIVKRAQEKGKVEIFVHDLRKYSSDKHHKVDDRPFGGGSGMVLQVEPIYRAVQAVKRKVKSEKCKVILLCPQGRKLDQAYAKKLSKNSNLILICGRYEGVDERVRQHVADEEVSIGDYILTGGELPAMVLVDSITRLIPGVLGDKNSLNFESFEGNLLEYPQYSRPAKFRNWRVPEVLVSGAHDRIGTWRRSEALKRTKKKRPDLLKNK
ncbi:MAG: tRNA (guanosine(37)-N1)-methyltransferase TrmD [Candidatus Omnitrophica bacterium]|nr:tRNA (guanosine(37)-N1)-methyltransferase TrmD [Candidatus Omnitrophota bacterium]MDD5042119.1 tRNA (guanosine(37)-N1)-methyltransferase TrmD [Candidatus Omnitrophota bacterium]MDD5500989.1 tRNA (guanosine(37)-N1)-methyltransferase TrmD [Candidatus Omnitrophota bacterium]